MIVVGATGFIGSAIVEAAMRRGLEVLPVRRWPEATPPAHAVVVNAAGITSGSGDELVEANVRHVHRLVGWCAAHGFPLLHLGSAAEYGDPGSSPVTESTVASPLSEYGRTKLIGTEVVLEAAGDGLLATVARVFNVIGDRPGRKDPISDLAHRVIRTPSGGQVEVGDASLVRDFASDAWVGDRLVDLLGHVGRFGVTNVCSGEGRSFAEVVEALARAMGKEVSVRDRHLGGIARVVGDPGRLRSIVGDRFAAEPLEHLARCALRGMPGATSGRRG